MTKKNEEEILKWFTDEISYPGYGEYFANDTPFDISILSPLGLNEKDLKPFTIDILQLLIKDDSFNELKLGIRAYTQFQDILDVKLDLNNPLENRHYCYYESLVYLRESVVSWLDKNILSAMVLIRPFMEISILHLYWYIRGEEKGYETYYQWMEGKKEKPPFRNQLDYIFTNLPTRNLLAPRRLSYIKEILSNFYKGMSSYNHTPKMDESVVKIGGGYGNVSVYSFYFLLENLKLLLRQIIYLYILAYPMSLFPVEKFRKWGYGGVLGVFFDTRRYVKCCVNSRLVRYPEQGLKSF